MKTLRNTFGVLATIAILSTFGQWLAAAWTSGVLSDHFRNSGCATMGLAFIIGMAWACTTDEMNREETIWHLERVVETLEKERDAQ